MCIDAVTWMEDQGLALAESRLWDEHGPIGRSLQSLLYGIAPLDPVALGGAALVMLLVSGAATYVPARAASLADPHALLRDGA